MVTISIDGLASPFPIDLAEDGQGLEMEELEAAHAAELQRLRAEHQVRHGFFMFCWGWG